MTAENPGTPRAPIPRPGSFNEAAADDRGKPRAKGPAPIPPALASMRPRPMTAENRTYRGVQRWDIDGFNEAAADDRGKPLPAGATMPFKSALQ